MARRSAGNALEKTYKEDEIRVLEGKNAPSKNSNLVTGAFGDSESIGTGRALPLAKELAKASSVIPALISMGSIYSFSAQTGEESAGLSYRASYGIISFINNIFTLGLSRFNMEGRARSYEFFIRKAAHFSEYFILALCVMLPLYVYKVKGRKKGIIAVIFCAIYACLDEFHQSFTAGRSPQFRDVIIDSLGAMAAVGICYAIHKIRE